MPEPQAQTPTPQTPPPPSPQDFLAKYRTKYDDARPDSDVLQKLSDPQNFRKAFGDEYDLSGKSDDDIKKFMGGTKKTTPPPAQDSLISRIGSGAWRGLKNVGSGIMGAGDLVNETIGAGALNPNKPTLMSMAQQSADQYKKIGETANDPYLANHPVARRAGEVGHALGMIPGVGPWAANMGETIGKNAGTPGGDVAGPVTEAATTLAVPKLASMALPAIGSGINSARESFGKATFTPEGKLTPVGEAIAHPIDKGMEFGLRKLFPPPQPEGVGATEPNASDFYQNKAEMLTKRGTQQATLDRAAARAIPKPAKGVMTIGEQGPQTLSSVARQTPFETPQPMNRGIGQTSTTGPEVKMVNKFEPPKPSGIVSPDSPPPTQEGSYWSFKEPALRQAVLSGDRHAAIIYQTRFGTMPEGAKYLTDVGSRPTRGLYQNDK